MNVASKHDKYLLPNPTKYSFQNLNVSFYSVGLISLGVDYTYLFEVLRGIFKCQAFKQNLKVFELQDKLQEPLTLLEHTFHTANLKLRFSFSSKTFHFESHQSLCFVCTLGLQKRILLLFHEICILFIHQLCVPVNQGRYSAKSLFSSGFESLLFQTAGVY